MGSKSPGDSTVRETARSPSTRAGPPRRNFLLALGAGGAGVAVVAAYSLGAGSAKPRPAQEPSPDGKGYELTDHVRRYYRTAKI
jgi:hypothetical protein